jgi:hypothetical protein
MPEEKRRPLAYPPGMIELQTRDAGFRSMGGLYMKWSEEIRLRDWADYYADLFLGAVLGLAGIAFFAFTTFYFTRTALEFRGAPAVVLRCISWNISALCLTLICLWLAALAMPIKRAVALHRFLGRLIYVLAGSAIFGLIGVVSFAFNWL